MSYPAFVWSNPATIGWNIADANGDPVLGAAVTATLYLGRSLDTPDTAPGTAVGTMSNLTLTEVGEGLYSVDIQADHIPAIGTDYVLVIDARVGGVLVRHWEEDTEVCSVSDSNPLCSLEAMKDHLGIDQTDTSQDSQLNRVINACSRNFMNLIRRPGFYPSTDRTSLIEVMNWQSESRLEDLYLPHYPVNSVESVMLDESVVIPAWDSTNPEFLGWVFDKTAPDESRQKITLRGVFWPTYTETFSYRRSVYRPTPVRLTVVYNAGYTEVPADVEQAIVEWVGYRKGLKELQAKDQTSQWLQLGQFQQNTSIASSTLKASEIAMPQSVMDVIQFYKRPL